MSLAMKHMSFTSSVASPKPVDEISDQFPAGLRVLVVDDDRTCLRIMEMMLKNCLYKVTKCNRAEMALKYLRDNKNGYDIVISDVHMPDMDGFKLLEHVGLEMDLPVIMMSADDSKHVVMKGVTHGACDYLIKPVHMGALKNIWQHVVRKRKHDGRDKEFEQSGCSREKSHEDVDNSSSGHEENMPNSNRNDEDDDEADERDDSLAVKKPRVVWSHELHQKFMIAVNQLGIDKAVPKKILELMNVPGLSRENVASHLQKYRLYLKRLSEGSSHQVDPAFAQISPLALDFQGCGAAAQFSPQNLATIPDSALARAAKCSSISPMPPSYQRNIFSVETPLIRLGKAQRQQNNNSEVSNFLHGIPTNMDSKQLTSLQQSAQSFGSVSMHAHSQIGHNGQQSTLSFGSMYALANSQAGQSSPSLIQPWPQSAYVGMSDNRASNLSPIARQSTTLLEQSRVQYVSRPPVYPSISQPTNAVDLSRCRGTEFMARNISVTTDSGISSPTSFQLQEIGSEMGVHRTFAPGYGAFNEMNRDSTQDLVLQNVARTSQALHTSQNVVGNENSAFNVESSIDQQLNASHTNVQDDDLMCALLGEAGEDVVRNEFNFDSYNLDNLLS